jgi:uncharacterized membrane protein
MVAANYNKRKASRCQRMPTYIEALHCEVVYEYPVLLILDSWRKQMRRKNRKIKITRFEKVSRIYKNYFKESAHRADPFHR